MPSNISVSISAETSDLTAKLAVAQSSVRGFGAELRKAADEMRNAGSGASAEMQANVERIAAQFAAAQNSAAGYRSELRATTGATTDAGLSFGALKKGIAAAFAALGVERVVEFARSMAEAGAQALHLSEQLGLSVQQVGAFEFAAQAMGVPVDQAATLLERLERNMSQAAGNAKGPAAQAFNALGISVTGADGHLKSLDTILPQIAEKFAATRDGPEKTAIAMALLGRAGAAMIPLLDEGKAGLDRMAQSALEAGSRTKEMAQRAEDTARAFGEAQAATTGLAASLFDKLDPIIRTEVTGWTRLTEAVTRFLNVTDQAKLDNLGTELRKIDSALAAGAAEGPIDENTGLVSRIGLSDAQMSTMRKRKAEVEAMIAEMQTRIADANKPQVETKPALPTMAGPDANQHKAAAEQTRALEEIGRATQEMARKNAAAVKKYVDDVQGSYREEAQGEVALAQMVLTQKEAAIRAAAAAGRISSSQEVAQLRQVATEEEAIAERALQSELADDKLSLTQKAHINTEILQQRQKLAADLAKIDEQAAQQQQRTAQQTFDKVTQPLNQMVRSVISGHQSIGEAAKAMWTGLASTAIENIAKIMLQELAHLAFSQAIDAAQKFSKAGVAAASVYADVAAIPYVGWILAPPAAAAAFAAVMAFDVGTPNVPSTMTATVHQGEGIVPATFMDAIRSNQLSLSGPGGGAGGAGPTIGLTVNAMNSQSVIQALRDPTTMRSFAAAFARYTNQSPSMA